MSPPRRQEPGFDPLLTPHTQGARGAGEPREGPRSAAPSERGRTVVPRTKHPSDRVPFDERADPDRPRGSMITLVLILACIVAAAALVSVLILNGGSSSGVPLHSTLKLSATRLRVSERFPVTCYKIGAASWQCGVPPATSREAFIAGFASDAGGASAQPAGAPNVALWGYAPYADAVVYLFLTGAKCERTAAAESDAGAVALYLFVGHGYFHAFHETGLDHLASPSSAAASGVPTRVCAYLQEDPQFIPSPSTQSTLQYATLVAQTGLSGSEQGLAGWSEYTAHRATSLPTLQETHSAATTQATTSSATSNETSMSATPRQTTSSGTTQAMTSSATSQQTTSTGTTQASTSSVTRRQTTPPANRAGSAAAVPATSTQTTAALGARS